jgi:acetate kinase
MKVLVPNLGSTSLKYQLLDMRDERVLARGKIERIGSQEARLQHQPAEGVGLEKTLYVPHHRAAIQLLVGTLFQADASPEERPDLVAFKTVHAGPEFCGTFVITDQVLQAMEWYASAAPLHNAIYIDAIRVFRELLPEVPLIGSFETGFHQTMREAAYLYGVPYEWLEKYGIRKYGFHGASHRYVATSVPRLLRRDGKDLRVISCHLGGSSSICAIRAGESADTTMGFSPQSGIENATRCGDLDAFIFVFLTEHAELTLGQLRDQVIQRGGLLGISGLSGDVRDLETAAQQGHAGARRALAVFFYEVKKAIGAYAAALGGVDALAFTGGIGENSWQTREEVCSGLEFLGLLLDKEKNKRTSGRDEIISSKESRDAILVIISNEELIVAREAVKVARSQT